MSEKAKAPVREHRGFGLFGEQDPAHLGKSGTAPKAPILGEVRAKLDRIKAEEAADINMGEAPTEQVMHVPHRAAQKRRNLIAGPK